MTILDRPMSPASAPDARQRLHVVYRSCSAENKKSRPSYYTKDLALHSMLRAAERLSVPCDMTFVNDGAIPRARLNVMQEAGEVLNFEGLGCEGSMRAALDVIARRSYGKDDIVYLSEDDYLYKASAFAQLCAVAECAPEVNYFGLYASLGPRGRDDKSQLIDAHVPRRWKAAAPRSVDGQIWSRGLSTTSSFGARPAALKRDILLMRVVMRSGGAWDHTTCLMYQGFLPFSWARLTQHFGPGTRWRNKLRSAAIRAAMNGLQLTRQMALARRHLLLAADPPLATHLESDHLAVGTDWKAVAADCEDWVRSRSNHGDPVLREAS